MTVVVAIQARTNSTRLPGKVLLPIGGYPLAVFAAKRAKQSSCFDVRVLTSSEESDDQLCSLLAQYEIPFFRGELDDVLSRYITAFETYDDETVVVRLTADNVFPDSSFINEVVEHFKTHRLDYVSANGENSGLPYGMSIEVTSLKNLRLAQKNTTSIFDREHVTPFVRRHFGEHYYKALHNNEFVGLRCTIDSFDDYIRMASLFREVSNPIQISSSKLMDKLKLRNQLVSPSVSQLTMGCVQIGLDYGVNNNLGKPSKKLAHAMLTEAVHSGVTYLDTARVYGESESIIGSWLKAGWASRVKVITKLSPLDELTGGSDLQVVEMAVQNSVLTSCVQLGRKKLDILMLHRAEHLKFCDRKIFNTLLRLKSKGIIKDLGVSVQTPEELLDALDCDEIKLIQMPFNLLDNRWNKIIPKLEKVKAERELNIHVRSVFLQGLLLSNQDDIYNRLIQSPEMVSACHSWLSDMCIRFRCGSIAELAIKYVKSQRWVDALVIGAESMEQLQENIKLISYNSLNEAEIQIIDDTRPTCIPERLINPALW